MTADPSVPCRAPPISCFQSSHPPHAEHPHFLVRKMRECWKQRTGWPFPESSCITALCSPYSVSSEITFYSSCSVKVPKFPCNQVKEAPIHYSPKIFIPEDSPTQRVLENQNQTEPRHGLVRNYLEVFQTCAFNLFQN